MKEVEILRQAEEGSCYDENLWHYKVINPGIDDIVIIRNYHYKTIKTIGVTTLNSNENWYIVEEVENCEKYIVKPLDTLKSVANMYNKSEKELKQKNNLKNDSLFIGQVLKIWKKRNTICIPFFIIYFLHQD